MTDWKIRQNRDGGWAYASGGRSWTEPTAYVLLAQTATQIDRTGFEAGLKFLRDTQRRDGGWSPRPDVAESTWVTAVAALLPEEAIGADAMKRALAWLNDQAGAESSFFFRLQQRLHGIHGDDSVGWPWFPGAAAWVTPTSVALLAFERALARRGFERAPARREDKEIRKRVNLAREFLTLRMCPDGGWNHGAAHALGRDSDSYPETTGQGLAALRSLPEEKDGESIKGAIGKAIHAARRHYATCNTAEGLAWLRIGLAAHGQIPPARPDLTAEPVARTTLDAALMAIASAPRNPLFA